MKTTVLICAFCMLISTDHLAQSNTVTPTKTGLTEKQLPSPVTAAFVKENAGISPVWKKEGPYFKATYLDPATNHGHAIVYESNGEVIRREKELENSEYPVKIKEYYDKNYPGEGFVIWSRLDSFGMQTFFAQRSSQMLTFDKEGNYIGPRKDSLRPEEKIRIIGSPE